MPVLKSWGVNYDPPAPILVSAGTQMLVQRTALETQTTDEGISTLHLALDVGGTVSGGPFRMLAKLGQCGSGCRVGAHVELPGQDRQVEILRFAKDGHSPFTPSGLARPLVAAWNVIKKVVHSSTRPFGFSWLITMEDGHPLIGSLAATVLESPGSSGRLELSGRMVIIYQPDNSRIPIRLLSRKDPVLAGLVSQWPPRGAIIELTNGPIEYFRDDQVDDSAAQPLLVVTSNKVTFDQEEASLLVVRPQIEQATLVGEDGNKWRAGQVAGVRLSWTDTRRLVDSSDPPVTHYHVFRRILNDQINGWVLAKSISANYNTWIDRTYKGTTATEYIVLHAANYNFGYQYECLLGTPIQIQPLVS